jgi:hypothetical protein
MIARVVALFDTLLQSQYYRAGSIKQFDAEAFGGKISGWRLAMSTQQNSCARDIGQLFVRNRCQALSAKALNLVAVVDDIAEAIERFYGSKSLFSFADSGNNAKAKT